MFFDAIMIEKNSKYHHDHASGLGDEMGEFMN
jgi:hypothetical protein